MINVDMKLSSIIVVRLIIVFLLVVGKDVHFADSLIRNKQEITPKKSSLKTPQHISNFQKNGGKAVDRGKAFIVYLAMGCTGTLISRDWVNF